MDDREYPTLAPELHIRPGSHPAPILTDVGRAADLDQKLVYYGDELQVSEGFAIALRAMDIEANPLPERIATIKPEPELGT